MDTNNFSVHPAPSDPAQISHSELQGFLCELCKVTNTVKCLNVQNQELNERLTISKHYISFSAPTATSTTTPPQTTTKSVLPKPKLDKFDGPHPPLPIRNSSWNLLTGPLTSTGLTSLSTCCNTSLVLLSTGSALGTLPMWDLTASPNCSLQPVLRSHQTRFCLNQTLHHVPKQPPSTSSIKISLTPYSNLTPDQLNQI
eukprot:Phypoly_transcript_01416.p1 GENE.Phypoly_transcript_01416~~Phypoly_transcript_01416.p1  ORF type:complete len:199 (-),score=22.21 Phypoly_transcript_01416:1998-2594(-)